MSHNIYFLGYKHCCSEF